jgi:HEAT repeat protein
VLQALRDPDEQVRYQALAKAQSFGVVLPEDVVRDLVQYDSSPVVRFFAVEALINLFENVSLPNQRNSLRAIAESALNDLDPHVRQRAEEVLAQLDNASKPQLETTPKP